MLHILRHFLHAFNVNKELGASLCGSWWNRHPLRIVNWELAASSLFALNAWSKCPNRWSMMEEASKLVEQVSKLVEHGGASV